MKAKKTDSQKSATPFANSQFPPPRVLQNFSRALSEHGFMQVIPPPVVGRKHLTDNKILLRHYGEEFYPFESGTSKEMVFPPTHVPAVVQYYLDRDSEGNLPLEKLFYAAPVFRMGKTGPVQQSELGAFIIGDQSNLAMAQLIHSVYRMLHSIGLENSTIEITSRGCPSCQKVFQESIEAEVAVSTDKLCQSCEKSLRDDITAVLDCQEPGCQAILGKQSMQLLDCLDESCRQNLAEVLEIIDELEIPYLLSQSTAPSFPQHSVLFRAGVTDSDNKATVLGHGGDFSSIFQINKKDKDPLPMIGFLSDWEKLNEHVSPEQVVGKLTAEVFIIPLGPFASRHAMVLGQELREAGIRIAESMLGSMGIKQQIKEATDRQAAIAVIIGQQEAMNETVILRDIRGGMQETFTRERIIEEIQKRLGR